MRRPTLASLALVLLACHTLAPTPTTPAPLPTAPAPEPAHASAPASASCQPTLPPPTAPAAPGPAYVLVDNVGILRIRDGLAELAVPAPSPSRTWSAELTAGPAGELWISDWQGVRILGADGRLRSIRSVKDGPCYENLRIRAADDVWAVTSDIEWSMMHYDGTRWTAVRRRSDFPGKFDDNKFTALAVTSDAVWVSSWNGLWRRANDTWQRIDPPASDVPDPELWIYRDRVIAGYLERAFLHDGAAWRPLQWPQTGMITRAVSDIGIVAAPAARRAAISIGSVEGGACIATSDPIHGSFVHRLVVDRAGRTWLATDHALAVVAADGRLLAEWTPGTLPGLTGRIRDIAVFDAGPTRLPAVQPSRTWELVGRLVTYKTSTPLAHAELDLCSAFSTNDTCPPHAFSRKTTTAADGSFRLPDVPEGEFWLNVRPPARLSDCDTPFTVSGHYLAPARDCKPTANAPNRCDLGTLTDCLPFEMPPMPP